MSRILLLLDHRENRRLLTEALSPRYEVIIPETDDALDASYDLCIFDGPALERLWQRAEARKGAEDPIFLPFLLVTSRQDVGLATRHLWHSVDELITTPIERVELQARVEILLRARQSSLQTDTERKRLEAVLQQMPAGVVIADASSGEVLLSNPQAASLFRLPSIAGASPDLYCDFNGMHSDGTPYRFDMCPLLRAIRQGEYVSDEEVIIAHDDGKHSQVLLRAAPIRDRVGQIIAGVMIATDITERKQAEEVLRESEERLRALVTATSDVVYRMSPDWSEMRQLSGRGFIADTETPNRTWLQLYIHPDDQSHVMAVINEAIRTKSIFELEHRVLRVDGSLGWTFSRAIPLLDANGEIVEWFGAASDITERKLSEEALRESEERLRLFIENAPAAIAMFDHDMRYLVVSRRWRDDYGLGEQEVIGRSHYELFPEIPDVWKDAHQRGLAGEVVQAKEDRFVRLDGTVQWLRWEVRPWHTADGVVGGIIIFTEDITERKLAEEALRESEERFRLAQEAAHIGMFDFDVLTGVNRWTPELEAMYGLPSGSFAGTRPAWEQLVHPEDRARAVQDLERAFETSEPSESDFRVTWPDGSVHWLSSRWRVMYDASGTPQRLLGVNIDITERKQAEQEIKTLNAELEHHVAMRTAQLEEANKELEAFSYSVSHDLRAPLRIIDGFSRALVKDYEEKLGDDGKADINWIRESVQKMGQLIDDLLRLSRIGRTEPHFTHVDLSALAQSIIDELRKEEPERQVTVLIQPGLLPCADAGLITIALENLLGNAWKFTGKTPDACIEFSIRDSEGEQVYFVQDNGAGFNMAYVDRLFTPFERLHSETDFKGIGIGLAIVRRIITMHGGRVWAEGVVGKGATFFFTLHPEGICI